MDYLRSSFIKKHIETINVQAAQANISLENVRDFEIIYPSIREQRAIADILTDMDAEIKALERRRDKTRVLKQGMMQELLTGRTRLNDD